MADSLVCGRCGRPVVMRHGRPGHAVLADAIACTVPHGPIPGVRTASGGELAPPEQPAYEQGERGSDMSRRRKRPEDAPPTVRFMCGDRYHEGKRYRTAVATLDGGTLTAAAGIRETWHGKWRITCRCGLDVEADPAVLAEIAAVMLAATPGTTQVDVPFGVLPRALADQRTPLDAQRAREIGAALAALPNRPGDGP